MSVEEDQVFVMDDIYGDLPEEEPEEPEPPKPKPKKKRKKRVLTEEERERMLDNLRRGRETSRKNRQKRAEAKKALSRKAKENIDKIVKGKADIEPTKEKEPEPEPEPKKATVKPKVAREKTPKKRQNELSAQQILLGQLNELKEENKRLRDMSYAPRVKTGDSKQPKPKKSAMPEPFNFSTFRKPRW